MGAWNERRKVGKRGLFQGNFCASPVAVKVRRNNQLVPIGPEKAPIPQSAPKQRFQGRFPPELSGPTARPSLSRYRVSLYLSHLCFSGIAGYSAKPTQIGPIVAEGRGWQGVSQLKLPSWRVFVSPRLDFPNKKRVIA